MLYDQTALAGSCGRVVNDLVRHEDLIRTWDGGYGEIDVARS